MSHRFSRAEKGKGIEDRPSLRKPLVRIPVSDSSSLIERNKYTLIGRVTNPAMQKTRALVDFFLQHWNVVGRITGRDLGPSLFQFCFESEQDLQAILSKSPFHFKRWMLILQRWEPIVSDSFPSAISFWITVHGVPLHYWSDLTFDAIGDALGLIEVRDFEKARMKIQVNGLKPLIMRMDIELPSKDVIEVELEYDKLEKHCFYCKSLSHEDDDCDIRPVSLQGRDKRTLGISQQNTLARIEEGKRRQEEKRQTRQHHGPSRDGARWTNYRNADHKDSRNPARDDFSRNVSERSSGFEENKRRYDDRNLSERSLPSSRRTPPRREPRDHLPLGHVSRAREVPDSSRSVLPRDSPSKAASSRSNHSPKTGAGSSQKRNSLASRLSDPREISSRSDERISAKERLSVHTQRTSLIGRTESIVNSKQLHAVEIQEFEDALPVPVINSTARPSSSTVFDAGRLGPSERSPIRTLSEDRVHVSLRLGPFLQPEEDESEDQQMTLAAFSKVAGKRKVGGSQSRKRTENSPGQAQGVKKRRVTKAHPSPKRKLMIDGITTGGRGSSAAARKTALSTKIIPPTVKKGKDFRPLPNPLP
ncbi:hypothetical protein Bca4012_013311 [Brassica carinata]